MKNNNNNTKQSTGSGSWLTDIEEKDVEFGDVDWRHSGIRLGEGQRVAESGGSIRLG